MAMSHPAPFTRAITGKGSGAVPLPATQPYPQGGPSTCTEVGIPYGLSVPRSIKLAPGMNEFSRKKKGRDREGFLINGGWSGGFPDAMRRELSFI